ncbi:phosphoribosylanthranilate isomerase [Candidatus Marinamargulisbacteria bacterium SCGC AG-343-D04]|nr:phosphoribosylanthranilate isomerase [Candidatus Marinamargulisbacteria bacterium SCGC AG-343-D04]
MKIKICGITKREDAENAIFFGVHALGFIFYSESSRYVSPETVQEINYFLPPFISSVGVFVNEDADRVNDITKSCKLDFVQLHGDESPEYCMKMDAKVIKAIRVGGLDDIQKIPQFQGSVTSILLDTKSEGSYGGTGKVFDWGLALSAKDFDVPIILSGGLDVDNIKKAVQLVNPYAVDINSGVESEPGVKDYNKIQDIISVLKDL